MSMKVDDKPLAHASGVPLMIEWDGSARVAMKRNNSQRLLERVDAVESNLFQLVLVLLAGGFIVVAGLLGIIAALLVFAG
jgi:hypothetical protein